MKKLPQGKELEKYARKLGVSLHNQASPTTGNDDAEIQRRVLEFLRHRRDNQLWLVAVFSSIAAMLSAAAAWYAVFSKPPCP